MVHPAVPHPLISQPVFTLAPHRTFANSAIPTVLKVDVTINGRQFRMACEEGEEPHLVRLAEDLDTRIARLRTRFGEIGDARLTVMAALTLADELSETKAKLQRLEPEVAALRDASTASAERADTTQGAIVAVLNVAAERIEAITRRLNETIPAASVPIG